jgi:hypothetical protein
MSEPDDDRTKDDDATPGNAQDVPVPHDQALEGSSEEFRKVQGVNPASATAEDDPPLAGDHKSLP